MPNLNRLSKFVSLIIRHRANDFGLYLDPQGYVDYAELRRVVAVAYPRVQPPEILYHGTTPQAAKSIRGDGLRSMERQYVHLSTNVERAWSVGSRRTEDVIILKINAGEAHRAGLEFFSPDPEHFLAKAIPSRFLEFPEN